MGISKTIHMIWPGKDPFKFRTVRSSWLQHNPDYNLLFWRDDPDPNFSPEVNAIIVDPKFCVTVKSNIMRLAVVYAYGGVYADTDMVCLKNFGPLLANDLVIGYEEQNEKRIGLSLIACTSKHPLVGEALALCLENTKKFSVEEHNKNSLRITSIEALQPVFEKAPFIYDQKYFYPQGYKERNGFFEITQEAYSLHLWMGAQPEGWCNKVIFA